jgi:hypothetical protein
MRREDDHELCIVKDLNRCHCDLFQGSIAAFAWETEEVIKVLRITGNLSKI